MVEKKQLFFYALGAIEVGVQSMRFLLSGAIIIGLAGCTLNDFDQIAKRPLSLMPGDFMGNTKPENAAQPLNKILIASKASVDIQNGFVSSVKNAVEADPNILVAKSDYLAMLKSIDVTKSFKDFQVSGAVYGGIEDVSDNTKGIAVVLNASKMVYDGGQLDSQISSEELAAQAAFNNYLVKLDERTLEATQVWVEFDRYSTLVNLIDSRLAVLDPLIKQLEKIAEAGLGDVSQVAAAQRTVAMIEVTQMDVEQRLEQAKVNFENFYGNLPPPSQFESKMIEQQVPQKISEDLVLKAPAIKAQYAAYRSALAGLSAVEARDSISVGFESKVQRPFGGSSYDSDESLGLVLSKTLYNGKKLSSEIAQARERANLQLESLRAVHRTGARTIETALQTINSMDKAILLAQENAVNSNDEISYLRKQLIIGQSTLDSVLSAEARLYEAESKEINFKAERLNAQLGLLAALGLLSDTFKIQ